MNYFNQVECIKKLKPLRIRSIIAGVALSIMLYFSVCNRIVENGNMIILYLLSFIVAV
ncbi:MAG: hypothetical protein AB7U79_07795 [Candidatus Izemoplasmatales bacterium]